MLGTNIQTCFHRRSLVLSRFLDFLAQTYKNRKATVGKNAMEHHIPNSDHFPLPFKPCIRFGYHGSFAFFLPHILDE